MVILILCQDAQEQNNGQDNLTKKQYIWNLLYSQPTVLSYEKGSQRIVILCYLITQHSQFLPWLPSEKLTIIIVIIFNNTFML